MKKFLLLSLFPIFALAQNNPNPGYWQQHVDYKMEVNMDVKKFQYTGKQEIVYTNNSNDTLHKIIIYSIIRFNLEVKWMQDFKPFLIQINEW